MLFGFMVAVLSILSTEAWTLKVAVIKRLEVLELPFS